MQNKKPALAALAALLSLLAGVGAVITATDQPGRTPSAPHHRTITVQLGGPGRARVPLEPAAQAIVRQQAAEDAAGKDNAAESDLHETALPTPADKAAARKATPPGQPRIPVNVTQAAASQTGCTSALVRNFSSRHGQPILLFVLHWTGSRSIFNSTADGLAIVSWFDRPISQASSTWVTDDDGHCWLTVPVAQKAWTQANYNSWSVSDEHVNPGAGPLFTRTAGRAKVLALMRYSHHVLKLPYRRGQVTQNGCRVLRSGYLAHRDLGTCGGGHPDVGNFDLDSLIQEAANGDKPARPSVTAKQRGWCHQLRAHRHAVLTGRHPSREQTRRAVKRRALLARDHVPCPRAR